LYLTDDDATVAGRLFAVAAKLAPEKKIADTGFRLVTTRGQMRIRRFSIFTCTASADAKLGHNAG
jgi:hypothetical protein